MAVSRGVPLYVIGRQSLFGYDRAHLLYIDPVTKDHYWPAIKRGPETAGLEMPPVRRPPRALGRAALRLRPLRAGPPGQGHRRHLLPAAQRGEHAGQASARRRTRSAPSRNTSPTTRAALAYLERRNKSDLRRSLASSRSSTARPPRTLVLRRHYPVDAERPGPGDRRGEPQGAWPGWTVLLEIEKRLRAAGEAPRPRAGEALAGPLRPDARPRSSTIRSRRTSTSPASRRWSP